LLCLLHSSCSTYYYQVFETRSEDSLDAKTLVFENEDLRLQYDFWSKGGQLYYTVYNKGNNPIHLDLSKCTFIQNGLAREWYTDGETTHTLMRDESFINTGVLKKSGSSRSITTRSAKFVYIPPKSTVVLSQFTFMESGYSTCEFNCKTKKKGLASSLNFSKETTPLSFRNYLVYSTSENASNTKRLDHSFYIETVRILTRKEYFGPSSPVLSCNEKGVETTTLIFERPYKRPGSFYLKLKY